MPPEPRTIVRNPDPVDEVRFHAAVMECVSKQIAQHGVGKVAQVMGLSVRQIANLGAGSMPRADRLANLRSLDRDALDPVHRLYGERAVPRDALCTSDPISARMAALLSQTIEMECPDSDGIASILTQLNGTFRGLSARLSKRTDLTRRQTALIDEMLDHELHKLADRLEKLGRDGALPDDHSAV